MSLPSRAKDTIEIERLECSVRNFLLRSACKANTFYTIREEKHVIPQENEENDVDSEEAEKNKYTEKHMVALPSVFLCNSNNPRNKLHITCLVSPPLQEHEEKRLKYEDEYLLSMRSKP